MSIFLATKFLEMGDLAKYINPIPKLTKEAKSN